MFLSPEPRPTCCPDSAETVPELASFSICDCHEMSEMLADQRFTTEEQFSRGLQVADTADPIQVTVGLEVVEDRL